MGEFFSFVTLCIELHCNIFVRVSFCKLIVFKRSIWKEKDQHLSEL